MKRKKIKEEEDEDKEGNKGRKIVVMMTDRKTFLSKLVIIQFG